MSPHKASSQSISEISEADSAEFKKIKSTGGSQYC